MPDFLETAVDKFIFRVATDRLYTSEGAWALADGDRVRVGVTDFLQQRNGDVAFVEVKAERHGRGGRRRGGDDRDDQGERRRCSRRSEAPSPR